MNWLEIAKRLPLQYNKHVVCPFCSAKGERPSASINNNIRTWSIHCYKCKTTKIQDKGVLSLEELRLQREALARADLPMDLSIPLAASTAFSAEARTWLQNNGISDSMARKYGLCFNEETQGVILPCYKTTQNGLQLTWLQERGVIEGAPKYRQPRRSKQGTWNNLPWGLSKVAVVTEDIASGVRISDATQDKINAHSLMGTFMNDSQLALLMNYEHVVLWLDSDRAGIDAVRKIRPMLRMFTKVTNITTAEDPKKLSNREILSHLKQQFAA